MGAMLKLQKGTLIALYAMTELARSDGDAVAVSEIAGVYGVSTHHLAKVLRQLVRRGLLTTTRGAKGGHRLARDPKDITLLDVIEVFEGPGRERQRCLVHDREQHCRESGTCRLRLVFDELDEQMRATLASISLRTIVKPLRALR
jgi:Rrf2 family nitric oxide-sensitive transcriptional repressor